MLTFMLLFTLGAAAQVVRVTGTVKNTQTREPIPGVSVVDQKLNRVIATTDEDGKFAVNSMEGRVLRFQLLGYNPVTAKIGRSHNISLHMEQKDVALSGGSVKGKRVTDKIAPEPTDIEVKGNWLHIRTRVRVPHEMFSRDKRIVVQPILENVTKKSNTVMRPMVLDGEEYHQTQGRMYGFDISHDPLSPYITRHTKALQEKNRANDIVGYEDSIYVENIKHDYTCHVYMAMENYVRLLYRDTTIIARGTVNPLRFLSYKFLGHEITDPTLYPKDEPQLREEKGEVNLRFPIGQSALDLSREENRKALSFLTSQIDNIRQGKDATLSSFTIKGTASPDGTLEANQKLAQGRMNAALDYIMKRLGGAETAQIERGASARVATWDEVARLLEQSGHETQAQQLRAVLRRHASTDSREARRELKALPFYRSLLMDSVLPALRKVEYQINYAVYRNLTIDEIKDLYAKDYHQLSRYEFFRLYREAQGEERERLCRQALEIYPHFMVAACDLQALLLQRGVPEDSLLRDFAGEKAPQTVNVNHTLALLDKGFYSEAGDIMHFVPRTDSTALLHAVVQALNGHYAEAYPVIATTGERNEVLMLLAMKRNDEALKKSEQLTSGEALDAYIQAICLNRHGEPEKAYEKLQAAFKLDASLRSIAEADGDVNDLLIDKEQQSEPAQ